MEILKEKIQTVANNVLRSLFTMWKKTIANCQENIGTFIKKEEELKYIENQIKNYSNKVLKVTLRIYALCISLRERNSRSYETLEESLQNSGLNNLFSLFWNRVCRIYSQSLVKLGENPNYTQQVVQKVFIENYPLFYKCHTDFWNKFCSETVPRSQIVFSELKMHLYDSIAVLKDNYLEKSLEMFKSMLEKIHTKLSKKTNDVMSCKIALKETKNV